MKTIKVTKPKSKSKKLLARKTHPYTVGEAYVFRTVTMYITGRVEAVYPQEITLTDAAWIPDTGRWSEFLKKPQSCVECELFPDGAVKGVSRGAIVDFCQIKELPRFTK
jgi:hypothetical protein